MVIGAAGELPKPPPTPVVFLEGLSANRHRFKTPDLRETVLRLRRLGTRTSACPTTLWYFCCFFSQSGRLSSSFLSPEIKGAEGRVVALVWRRYETATTAPP